MSIFRNLNAKCDGQTDRRTVYGRNPLRKKPPSLKTSGRKKPPFIISSDELGLSCSSGDDVGLSLGSDIGMSLSSSSESSCDDDWDVQLSIDTFSHETCKPSTVL
ncbi:hypothetical protein DPMN_089361 [Dreissena polymorpha]|uniref:Uncharacterized protein n=1 Tax=Dreissena polymorpha TaxID=45954 RepID=A0A9D4QXC9_DREPO|nr:hypothetical protein DPMN_089361 [Dreissena polymorpha]